MKKNQITQKGLERETQVYEFLVDFYRRNGYTPTVRDIISSQALPLKSTASAKHYLDILAEKGKISRSGPYMSGYAIVDVPVEDTSTTKIPFLGNVAAGAPLLAGVENDRTFALPNDYFDVRTQNFLLQVRGNSMIEMGILDGDVILVKKQATAMNGQVVVAQIDNEEVTLKRFYNCGSYIKLHPENSEMEDIIITSEHSFAILGIANGLMRNHIV